MRTVATFTPATEAPTAVARSHSSAAATAPASSIVYKNTGVGPTAPPTPGPLDSVRREKAAVTNPGAADAAPEPAGEADAVEEPVPVPEGELLGVRALDGVTERVAALEGVTLPDTLPVSEPLAVSGGVRVAVRLREPDRERERLLLPVRLAVAVCVSDSLADTEAVSDPDALQVSDSVFDAVSDSVSEPDAVSLPVPDAVGVSVRVLVSELLWVSPIDSEAVPLSVLEAVLVLLPEDEDVDVLVPDRVPVEVADADCDAVGVADRVLEGDAVAVSVADGVSVSEPVAEDVVEKLMLAVLEREADRDRDMLRDCDALDETEVETVAVPLTDCDAVMDTAAASTAQACIINCVQHPRPSRPMRDVLQGTFKSAERTPDVSWSLSGNRTKGRDNNNERTLSNQPTVSPDVHLSQLGLPIRMKCPFAVTLRDSLKPVMTVALPPVLPRCAPPKTHNRQPRCKSSRGAA